MPLHPKALLTLALIIGAVIQIERFFDWITGEEPPPPPTAEEIAHFNERMSTMAGLRQAFGSCDLAQVQFFLEEGWDPNDVIHETVYGEYPTHTIMIADTFSTIGYVSALRRKGPPVSQNHSPPVPCMTNAVCFDAPEVVQRWPTSS